MRLLSPVVTTYFAVLIFGAHAVLAQNSGNFSIPNTWQNTTSLLSRQARRAIAKGAIDQILLNAPGGTVPNIDAVEETSLVSVLSLYDFFSGSTVNQNDVTTTQAYVQAYVQARIDPKNMSQSLHFGLASYYAYRAYGTRLFLDAAIQSWRTANERMLTPQAAQNGSLTFPTPNANSTGSGNDTIDVQNSCNGQTVAGAVFEFPTDQKQSSSLIQAETMGAFLALSSYLIGKQDGAFVAANLSATFIQAHVINNSVVNPLQLDISSDSCAVTVDDQTGMMNIGLIIEGLSVWANQSSNASLSNFVNDLIVQVISHTWTGSNGVITQESGNPGDVQSGVKAWFIRGLHEAWSRMRDQNSGPASFIAAYITVQFNALHNMSPNGDYSTNWTLPSTNASAMFDPWAQVVALDVLNSAFDIIPPATNGTSANPSSPSPTSTSSNLSDKSSISHIGAIAGGTVGGGAAIAVVVGAAIFFLRRRKYRTVNKAPSSFFADRLVSPPSAALINQGQDYGLPRMEKHNREESDSTESSLGIAV